MENLKDLMKKANRHQLLLSSLFLLYIVFNVRTPALLATLVDNLAGHVVIIILAIGLMLYANPVLGVLGLITAYELLKRSSVATGTHAIRNFLPSEIKKGQHFTAFNQFPVTLEEEVVHKMVPMVTHAPPPNVNYKPVLNPLHQASSVI